MVRRGAFGVRFARVAPDRIRAARRLDSFFRDPGRQARRVARGDARGNRCDQTKALCLMKRPGKRAAQGGALGGTGMSEQFDLEKRQREEARWRILRVVDAGRPIAVTEQVVWRVLADIKLAF